MDTKVIKKKAIIVALIYLIIGLSINIILPRPISVHYLYFYFMPFIEVVVTIQIPLFGWHLINYDYGDFQRNFLGYLELVGALVNTVFVFYIAKKFFSRTTIFSRILVIIIALVVTFVLYMGPITYFVWEMRNFN